MSEGKVKSAGQVRSLTRALSLLRYLAVSSDGMSLTELSEAAGLPPSTTHRLLTTLESERFVRPDPQGGVWRIGVAAFFVGSAFARSRDKLGLARPYLRRLMEMSGETANLFVESDGEAVCIGQIESRHAMRAITGVGGRVALHASAVGKALLAHMDPMRRSRILSTMPLERATANSVTERGRLEAILNEVSAVGYAIDNEEHALGLRCVAAPIFDEYGQAVAAVSVSGPSARIPTERLATLGRMTAQAAAEATRDYGGAPPVAAQ
ncbi:helix-turn-helix domain-containing protein [Limibaculum sp. M0105]|uniref:Helix-turn-helix domain-containing protein n=1 Tax=Thermohalobaculum xanthum TaxID=2753746 RepID=A0A8J7M647_9RHOB|nr:IclR family transcriptional regulator C-terminal domain-containing protein [Thermohalobaculum xanthum]MBK0398557.1 helix-turn-helix domain-containing protein [Thermohalobaculum xanthum]